jgi:hypothetical protein
MRITCLLPLFFLLASCATMIHGKDQTIAITSQPPGAIVYYEGETLGTTPLEVSLPRKIDHDITVVKQGFHQEDVEIKRKLSATTLLYALPLGIVWFGIDNINGAQFEFEEELKVQLKPLFQNKEVISRQMKTMRSMTHSFLERTIVPIESKSTQHQKSMSNRAE